MDKQLIPLATKPINAIVEIPGSKSLTNRALLLAALADGTSTLKNVLFSDDTRYFSEGLQQLGIEVSKNEVEKAFTINGLGGQIPAHEASLFVGNAGTAARFLTATFGLGTGAFKIDGIPAMRLRPMSALLDALQQQGCSVDFQEKEGFLPLTLHGTGLSGGEVHLSAKATSQALTAVLMVAPYAKNDTRILIEDELVSKPYIEMTIRLMQEWGVMVETDRDFRRFSIQSGQKYTAQPTYIIEPDASGASYFFAAAAVTNGRVNVQNLGQNSSQGDVHFVDILQKMGCEVHYGDNHIELIGSETLEGVDVDMNAISDTVPTLAAIAPFAKAPVTIRNVGHIRHKETDRISAVVNELRRLGATVDEFDDGLTIYPSQLHGAEVKTYDDHRIAMSFAITGLRTPDVEILDPGCTSKTFPEFFDILFNIL